MGVATGLDYAGVEALMRIRGTPADPETFALLQVCERAALVAMSDKQQAERRRHGRR